MNDDEDIRNRKQGSGQGDYNRNVNCKCIYLIWMILLTFVLPLSALCETFTVTNANDSGTGSFREAMIDANNSPGTDTIRFNIGNGVQTIPVTSSWPLTAITEPVTIDGTSQPGYAGTPLIVIDGTSAGAVNGLQVSAGDSVIKGIAVVNFYGDGILIDTNGGNLLTGNYVGIDATGTTAQGNGISIGANGIGVLSSNNTIGGTSALDRNVISGNGGNGITVGDGASNNLVLGNYVGTNAAGTAAVPNGADGVLIVNSTNNTVGGTDGVTVSGSCTGACNLLSGNGANGLGIWKSGATGNVVKGNFIGVDYTGTTALPNQDIGLEIQDSPGNTVGGTSPSDRNIMSGNYGAGLSLTGTLSTNNVVLGNYIGTDTTGKTAVKNHKMGLNIGSPDGGSSNANNNIVGGTNGVTPAGACTGACNVISGNGWSGVYISGSNGGNNQVLGNFIGAGADGSSVPNEQDGVGIVDSPANTIGGSCVCDRNIISGNGSNGVSVIGDLSVGTRIQGNYIGLATDKNTMPNEVTGVAIAAGTNTAVLANSIYSNVFLGIDVSLGGTSANDPGDADIGPNNMQNFPILSGATEQTDGTEISGSLNSSANGTFRLDFFSSPVCSQYKNGQGYQFLGSTTVTTDGSGNATFSFKSVFSVAPGHALTATSTAVINGAASETSEFSECITFQGSGVNQGNLSATADEDRIFNWAEASYPQLFPGTPSSQCYAGYYFRYYAGSNVYLAGKDGQIYYFEANDGSGLLDVGGVYDFLPFALGAGF